MKIKNIAFTGFMAAILGATAAQAADPVQLISKTYADRELQAKLTAGTGITIAADGKTISANMDELKVGEKTVAEAIAAAQSAANTAQGEVDALETVVGSLEGKNAATIVDYIEKKTEGIATNAALAELQETVDGHTTSINTLNGDAETTGSVANSIATALTSYSTTEQMEQAIETAKGAAETTAKGYADANAAAITEITKVGGTIDTKVSAAQSAAEGKAATAQAAADAAQDAAEAAQAAADAAQDDVDAVEGRMDTAEGKISALETASATHALKTDLNAYRTSADQDVIDDEIKADVQENATAISTLNAAAVKTIGAGQAGRYVIDFDAEGKASYTAIQIVE